MFREQVKPGPPMTQAPKIVPSQNIVCVTCLTSCQYRTMHPIPDPILFSSVTLIKLPSICNYKVCWECLAMLGKIQKFRRKALSAQMILHENKTSLQSLSTLKTSNLVHWLSIVIQSQIEINPLVANEKPQLPATTLKGEVIESETLRPEPQSIYCNEEDPFGEFPVKTETEVSIEEETSCVDIIKSEFDSNSNCSSDDEPLLLARKSNVAYIQTRNQESSDTETASEEDTINKTVILKPNTSTSNTVQHLNDFPIRVTAGQETIQLPFIDSMSPELRKDTNEPVKYHTGPKLFKNSPQLTIPEQFRSIDNTYKTDNGDTDNIYEVHRLTDEELNELRAKNLQKARTKMYMFFCEKCMLLFMKQADLDGHMKKHDKSAGSFLCSICEQRFMTQEVLDEHKEDHYKFYICDKCKEKFFSLKSLLRHDETRHRETLRYCRICDAKFTSHSIPFSLISARFGIITLLLFFQSAGSFLCSICEQRFMTQEVLDEHKEDHYKFYICDKCKEKFFSLKSLLRHDETRHRETLRYCRICDAKFTDLKEYYKHNQTHKEKIECEVCHEKCQPSKIRTHMAKHTELPWVRCDVCKKDFRGLSRLMSHKRYLHAPVDDGCYCVECDISFKSRSLYNTHMRYSIKHVPDSEKVFCRQCNKPFRSQSVLNKHIAVAHEDSERSECDICKKVFKSKTAVRTHIKRKHLKSKLNVERNKMCDICGKAFQFKSCLEQHMNSHYNIRPFKCEECGATFSYSGARYTHIKLKHRKNKNGNKNKTES
ncbi:zinc finger protein 595-like [Plodia interpunctella]|uniref:zinc finger protein 595-like n=1 Tax=Plodia interpunctella TaxID=58824 RepID=UPI0023687D17|nr:zinc finger protein 595-like [Plodia interpunctella]